MNYGFSTSSLVLAFSVEKCFMSEKDLRRLVKQFMGGDVTWVEPTFGSSVGRPDANFNVGGFEFPVELKVWDLTKKGLRSKMRPAQIRYHIMSARKGMRTAILFELPSGLLYLVAGKNCPLAAYKLWLVDCQLIGHNSEDLKKRLYVGVRKVLLDDKFWEN